MQQAPPAPDCPLGLDEIDDSDVRAMWQGSQPMKPPRHPKPRLVFHDGTEWVPVGDLSDRAMADRRDRARLALREWRHGVGCLFPSTPEVIEGGIVHLRGQTVSGSAARRLVRCVRVRGFSGGTIDMDADAQPLDMPWVSVLVINDDMSGSVRFVGYDEPPTLPRNEQGDLQFRNAVRIGRMERGDVAMSEHVNTEAKRIAEDAFRLAAKQAVAEALRDRVLEKTTALNLDGVDVYPAPR